MPILVRHNSAHPDFARFTLPAAGLRKHLQISVCILLNEIVKPINWRMNTGDWLKTKKANRKKTILVVDDEGFLVDVLFEILDSYGYSVLTATSGEEALRVAKKASHVDLLLTDLIMKPMNGPQLAEELKKANPDVKVLFMSGYTQDYIREKLGLHNIAFMIKPISAQDLLEKVPQLLGPTSEIES